MEPLNYFHNPKCSKSRKGIEVLNSQGVSFQTIEYLKETLSKDQIKGLLHKLDLSPKDIIRQNNDSFKKWGPKTPFENEERWIELIVENPELLQRPILEGRDKAIIGRPTENISDFLKDL